MSYSLRNKKKMVGGPAGDAGNEQVNKKAEKPFVPPPDQSNSSKEDKTNVTKQHDLKTTIAKTSIATELGNVNHNLDVFTQNIQEDATKFNKDTIPTIEICNKLEHNESKIEYQFVCKIGCGGFSIVWLVIDRKSKEFKAAKVFKYRRGIPKLERNILQQTANHPNILRYYETLYFQYGGRPACVAIYEPLGKDLNMLMKEASKHGGLSVPVIKKVAKHVLMALETLHGLKVIHSDIKLHNIATCVSQLSLRNQLEKIVEFMKSGKNISSLRMVCRKDIKIDENKKRKKLEEELDEVSKLEIKDVTELIFKLIDFGNAMKEGKESPTGTYGFRPPEYFFGSPLLSSHDIWSLGVAIVVLLTNKTFLEYGNGSKIDDSDIGPSTSTSICATRLATAKETPNRNDICEITSLRTMFGMFPRRHFKNFKDLHGYKTKFSTRYYSPVKAVKRIEKFLRIKFDKLQMDDNNRNGLIGFLLQMLNTIPNERKSAAELLLDPWLNDISECDFNSKIDLTQKSSDSIKTQERKETSIYEIETSHAYVAVSSPSNSKDTSETPLDDLSNEELVKIKNVVISLPSTDPKHSKNGGEATEKTKKESKKILRYDSFIYKDDDDKLYLYHKYWRISYRGDNLFQCPKCARSIYLEAKVGFVMVSDKSWHQKKCVVCEKLAPKKGQKIYVRYYPAQQEGYKLCKKWITKEDVDRKRELLEEQGFKKLSDPVLPEEICQKEAQINDNYYERDLIETDETVDSDTDETEEDSNETMSEFGSGESYIEEDASNAPYMEDFSDDEIWNLVD